MRPIYVAATGQHVGKTTSTLGIIANLNNIGIKTGYCKPVGQKFLSVKDDKVDKDAVLFSDIIGFDLIPEYHSPVILAKGVSQAFIEQPHRFNFKKDILDAASYFDKHYDTMVYEGTGHPGVGAVVDLSNAVVAKLLGAGVVMIAEGGIGKTFDQLHMSLALFREQKVPVLGVIINKVRPDKIDTIHFYLEKKLQQYGIPILGLLPYDEMLSFPIIETIMQAVDGKILLNAGSMNNPVEDIVAGSLVDVDEFSSFKNILLVVSIKRLNEAIKKIKAISRIKALKKSPLSGVIVTGDGRHAHWYSETELQNPYFKEHNIPVLSTSLDTYGSVVKISRIEVKINTRTPWKAKRAINLIEQRVNFDLLLERAKSI